MRKTFIFLAALGLLAGFASTARAEYSISVGYNTGRTYSKSCGGSTYSGRNTHYPKAYRHYPGVYYNQRHYTYYPYLYHSYSYYPVIVQKRIVYEQEKQSGNGKERFGISDIIVLSRAGVNDNTIIEKIRKTGSVFDLSVEEVEVLRKEGVSSRVVNYMLNT